MSPVKSLFAQPPYSAASINVYIFFAQRTIIGMHVSYDDKIGIIMPLLCQSHQKTA